MNWWSKHTDPATYQKRIGTKPFDFIAKQYGKNDSVLDVGCGAAVWYENHLHYGKKGEYTGTDVTPEYLIEAEKKYPEVEWICCPAENLSERISVTYDIVLMVHVLEYTNGYKTPILEALQLVTKKVIIVLWAGLWDKPDDIAPVDSKEGGHCNQYNRFKFNMFLDMLPVKVPVREKLIMDGDKYNYIWVLEKRQQLANTDPLPTTEEENTINYYKGSLHDITNIR